MPRIFISHSSKDNAFAERLALALRARGAEVWIDLSNILAGMKWSTAIQQGLDSCELMILVISPESMESTNVEDEWQYYIDDKKPIVPVRWIPAKVHFQLRRHQYVDFHQQEFDAAVVQLVKELARNGFAVNTTPPLPPLRIQGGEKENAPDAPPHLVSEKGQGDDARTFPRFLKPDWVGKIIPEPFEWCVVPAGKVILTDLGGYLNETTTFGVPEFQIARYPITNAQFEAFHIAEDGWQNRGWWGFSEEAIIWRQKHDEPESAIFRDCIDCPRERVSWYACVAFTRWLSAKVGEKITLPTEQQWQRAAQGDDNRIYPWGNEWDGDRCNNSTDNLHRSNATTPVSYYPNGASPYGVMDMIGNVWEWCMTDWRTGNSGIDGTDERLRRGGSWAAHYKYYFRSDLRSMYIPRYWNLDCGFRVVRF